MPAQRDRRDSPVFALFDAATRLYQAEKDVMRASVDAVQEHLAGRCLTCRAPVEEDGAKLCHACADDVAEAGTEIAVRAVAPALEAVLGELLRGRGGRLPPRE